MAAELSPGPCWFYLQFILCIRSSIPTCPFLPLHHNQQRLQKGGRQAVGAACGGAWAASSSLQWQKVSNPWLRTRGPPDVLSTGLVSPELSRTLSVLNCIVLPGLKLSPTSMLRFNTKVAYPEKTGFHQVRKLHCLVACLVNKCMENHDWERL